MTIVIIKGTPDIKRAAALLDSKLGGACAPVAPPPGSSALAFSILIKLAAVVNLWLQNVCFEMYAYNF